MSPAPPLTFLSVASAGPRAAAVLGRVELLAGLVLTAVAATLSLRFSLFAGPLWRDEVSTLNLATRPAYQDVLAALHLDSAPLLYPTLVRFWASVPWTDEDAAMRLLGFFVSLAGVAVLWLNARALGMRAPLLALALFALQGTTVQTASTLKPYGIATVFSLAAFGALAVAVVRPARTPLVVAALCAVLTVQSSYVHVPVMLAVVCAGVVVAALDDRRWAASIAGIGAAAVLSLGVYTSILLRSRDWRPLNEMRFSVADVSRWIVRDFTHGSAWISAVWGVVIVVSLYAVGTRWRSARDDPGARRLVYGVVAAAAAVAAFVVFVMITHRPAQPWHGVQLLAVGAIAADLVLCTTWRWRAARLALAVLAALVIVPGAIQQVAVRQTNVDEVARYIEKGATPDDLVVVNPWYLGISFTRYYRGPAPVMTIPPIDDLSMHRYDMLKERMVASSPLEPLHARIRATLQSGHRVWLVGGVLFVPPRQVPTTLPPAPNAPTGWMDYPYQIAWSTQTGYIVQNEALRWRVMKPGFEVPLQRFEQPHLLVVDGWRDGRS
jgi:hypothetical protein